MFLKNLTGKVCIRVVGCTKPEMCVRIADDATPYCTLNAFNFAIAMACFTCWWLIKYSARECRIYVQSWEGGPWPPDIFLLRF